MVAGGYQSGVIEPPQATTESCTWEMQRRIKTIMTRNLLREHADRWLRQSTKGMSRLPV